MKSKERIVTSVALIFLGAMNLVFLLSNAGRAAFAEAGAFIAQTLGPAEELKLIGEGGKEVSVRAKSGRIAWGEGDFRQTYTLAFVDIGKAINPLMEASDLVEEREALRQELETAEKDFTARLEAVSQELRGMDQNSPEFREKYEAATKLYEEYQTWGREVALKKRDEMDVKHLQRVYKELTSAVNIVADRLGIDVVLRFIPTDKDFIALNADQALSEVRLRSAVKYPERLDITSEVLQELNVQDAGQ
jgi:Skp family chaperone for outer membrane proteins